MRVACVLVTHLRAKAEMKRHPHLKDSPVLVVDRDPSRAKPLVVDRFPEASQAMAGMTLEQAASVRSSAATALPVSAWDISAPLSEVLCLIQGANHSSKLLDFLYLNSVPLSLTVYSWERRRRRPRLPPTPRSRPRASG